MICKEDSAVSLDKFIGHNVKDALEERQPIFLHFPSPYLTYPCLIMIPGLPVILLRVLMPSLSHFPFLHKENTDKEEKIDTQNVLQARLKYSVSGI